MALLFTIALGIASMVSLRGFVQGLTKPSFPLGSLDHLVSVFGRDAHHEAGPLSKQQYLYARNRDHVFEWLGAARISTGTITVAGKTAFLPIAAVTPNLAAAFGIPLDQGVVISHRIWRAEFGESANVRGEDIQINGVTARIGGIAPDWLEGIYRDRPVDVWIPLPEEVLQQLDSSRNLWVVARLGQDISPSRAKLVLQQEGRTGELSVVPYTGLTPERAAHLSQIGMLLEFAAGAVFFIACVNVALLLLGRASERFHETALRVALGASRGQLVLELLSDSIVISVAGGALGVLLGVWTSYLVPALLYDRDAERLIFAPNLFTIAEASFVFVGIMILCGLLPAIAIPLNRPMSVIQRDSTGASPAIRHLRMGLVVAQMASCCVLVISTAFLIDGLHLALVTSAGQRLGHAVFATVQANPLVAMDYFPQAEKAVRSVPGVSGTAWAETLPGGQPMMQSFRIEPAQLSLREVTLDSDWIASGSLNLFDLPPKAGHMFGIGQQTCGAVVVNEEAAEELFGGHTVGRTLRDGKSPLPVEIIGVLAMRKSEKTFNRPTVYFDYTARQEAPPRRITDMRFRAPIASELPTADLETNVVSPDYFDALGNKLIAGQGFIGDIKSTGCRVGIVNQEAADLYFGGNAVGAAVIDERGRRTNIIGIVDSASLGAFQQRVNAALYLPMSQDVLTSMSMIINIQEANGPLLTDLRRRLEEVPGHGPGPVVARTFKTYLNQTSLAPLRIATLLLGVCATMALALNVLGLFGALSDAARQRRRELAIRVGLGAPRLRVIRQVLAEGVLLACAGTVAGIVASLGLSRWMSGITASSGLPALWVWLAAPLALTAVVATASVLPARRALMTNPLAIMREDT